MFLEVRNLSKSFKTRKAVDAVSFSVESGEIFGLLGPNGAGKSTTISMLASLLSPDAGEITIAGYDIRKKPAAVKDIIGLVPQEIALYANMAARDNLFFWGRMYGLRGKALESRVKEVLSVVGLEERAKERVDKYSGGMKRRLNLGIALLHRPGLLIMDEPTVGIDPQSRNHIFETIKQLNSEGMTIIYASHYMEEIEYLCRRVAILDEGKIIALGTIQELKNSIGNRDVIEIKFKGDSSVFSERLQNVDGLGEWAVKEDMLIVTAERGRGMLPVIFRVLNDTEVKIEAIGIKEASLESVFLKLTGKALRD